MALPIAAKGFVWRLADDSGNATGFRPFPDPQMAVNLSVWDSVEALEQFVWQTVHKRFYGRRPEWFDTMDGPHFVMWWVPAGASAAARRGERAAGASRGAWAERPCVRLGKRCRGAIVENGAMRARRAGGLTA